MFTGLVEGQARVVSMEADGPGVRLVLAPPPLPPLGPGDELAVGDSVACNGCCLTVVALEGGHLAFEAGEETLSRTNLGRLRAGDPVNVERSLPATGRLGGHFVLGHVDCVGRVEAIRPDGEWVHMTFSAPAEHDRLLIEKGSCTVDGISLTVFDIAADAGRVRFTVALIPHTLGVTTLGVREIGDAVNLEFDVLGKYVAKAAVASPD